MSFGLAVLEASLLDLAADALSDAGRRAPSEVVRYNGEPAVQCCEGDGVLYVYWQPVKMENGRQRGMRRQADLYLRLYRCCGSLGPHGEPPSDSDIIAEELATDLDVLLSALAQAVCSGSQLDELLTGCQSLEIVDAIPRPPRGGCAGIQVHLRAAWRPYRFES